MSTLVVAATAAAALAAHAAGGELGDLSLEELTQVTVMSVSKRAEVLFETPASIHVITSADIQRAGVRTVPEALRLAPGVEVARTGPDDWSITMRGLNSDLSNKLLVLIDGRSVTPRCTPACSGTCSRCCSRTWTASRSSAGRPARSGARTR